MGKRKTGQETGILSEQVIRDLKNAAWFKQLNSGNTDVDSPESELFYLRRAVQYQETIDQEKERS